MGKIYCMMGKSSTGKDTLYKMLLEDGALSLKKIIPTRRGRCAGEKRTAWNIISAERRNWPIF